jgi:hypothetical protein
VLLLQSWPYFGSSSSSRGVHKGGAWLAPSLLQLLPCQVLLRALTASLAQVLLLLFLCNCCCSCSCSLHGGTACSQAWRWVWRRSAAAS